jgi:hypothetical protein
MKKLIFALIAVLGFAFTSSAQDTKKKEVKTTKEVKKTDPKVVLKKDGTPDKRYKENKEPKVVLKKDGTPDKRYTKKK